MDVHSKIYNSKSHLAIDMDDRIYVGFNPYLLEKGDYFYGFSHMPKHKIKIPKDTFTFTILRDPVKRLISHYKMINEFKRRNRNHPSYKLEGKWLGNSFSEFLDNVPDNYLMNQLYMFSENLNVNEAFKNINKCSQVIFLDDFDKGVRELFKKIKINEISNIFHERKSDFNFEPSQSDLEKAKEKLAPEIELIDKLKLSKK